MNKPSTQVALVALVVLLVLGVGYEIVSMSGNGEHRNPNVGHPTDSGLKGLGNHGKDMTEADYINNLKINNPSLSDSERQARADKWWQTKSAGRAQDRN